MLSYVKAPNAVQSLHNMKTYIRPHYPTQELIMPSSLCINVSLGPVRDIPG